jgi:molybdenum cofactor biosynthesis enzyme MoaA
MIFFAGRILEKRSLNMSSSLNKIGFYTLTDARAKEFHSNLERCEMIVTEACNFRCPYCRGVGAYSRDCRGHIDFGIAKTVLDTWISQRLKAVRFSGGEPTLYPRIKELVTIAKDGGISHIAISTNGSMPTERYIELHGLGVNDFSISLDACCAEDADRMAGRSSGFDNIVENIKVLSAMTYVTVGIVLTEYTESTVVDVVKFADALGVADIRIISAAQYNGALSKLRDIPAYILDAHPILQYRVNNLLSGKNVRGISNSDSKKCYLVQDDMVVAGKWHFPCVIHMREGGEPIGEIGETMRLDRFVWSETHDTHADPICKKNCLDCLVDYNNKAEEIE